MWQRFTERARRVVFFAQEEAARLGENYVGTEHLLLGLVRESDSVAARILDRLGVSLGMIRADVERQVTRGHGNLGQDMQLTPRSKRVIDLAYDCARQLNNNYIGTEHILMGLIREGDGLAARVLIKMGATELRVHDVVVEWQEEAAAKGTGGPLQDTIRSGTASPEDAGRELASVRFAMLGQRRIQEALGLARKACGGLTDLLSIADLASVQLRAVLDFARLLKGTRTDDPYAQEWILRRKNAALIFEKPSLRTRVTFEVGMFQLGGKAIHLGPSEIQMGGRESVADVARNLELWVDGIVARTHRHETLLELAENANVPVINALSDQEHPCQALADMLTIMEHRPDPAGFRLAYIGDGNNVANSLLHACARLGIHLTLGCPEGYEPDAAVVAAARVEAAKTGSDLTVVRDPRAAVRDADAVYTDVWASMGQEAEAAAREPIFRPYQLNAELLAAAKPDALAMHCLPAHRGHEITDEVMDGPQSVVFEQARNRLHAQKAILAVLL